MHHRTAMALLGAALLHGAIASAQPRRRPPSGGTRVVDVRVFQFQPGTVSVRRGTRVVWVNHDETAHTVTSIPADSGAPPDRTLSLTLRTRGDTAGVVLRRAGRFRYRCERHPSMTGDVLVMP